MLAACLLRSCCVLACCMLAACLLLAWCVFDACFVRALCVLAVTICWVFRLPDLQHWTCTGLLSQIANYFQFCMYMNSFDYNLGSPSRSASCDTVIVDRTTWASFSGFQAKIKLFSPWNWHTSHRYNGNRRRKNKYVQLTFVICSFGPQISALRVETNLPWQTQLTFKELRKEDPLV